MQGLTPAAIACLLPVCKDGPCSQPDLPHPCAQEARFDRHFVRDLTWSRHQLEQLAERRFVAAQRPSTSLAPDATSSASSPGQGPMQFASLFEKVRLPFASKAAHHAKRAKMFCFFLTQIYRVHEVGGFCTHGTIQDRAALACGCSCLMS